MKQFIKWYGVCKINEQIRWAIIGLSVCSTVILGIFCFVLSKYMIERNYKQDFTYNLEMSNEIADIQLNNIIEITRTMLTNSGFMEVLEESGGQEGTYFSSSHSHKLEKILGSVATQEMLIGEMIVVDKSGKLYCYATNAGESRNYKLEKITEKNWIQDARGAKGKEIFYTVNILQPDKKYTFSMVKELVDPYSGKELGYIIINIRKKLFEKAFASSGRGGGSNFFMAIAADNKIPIAYFQGKEEMKDDIEEDYFSDHSLSAGFVFAEVKNDTTGWNFVSVVQRSQLIKDSNIIGMLILILIVIIIALGIYISKYISTRIYEPLNQLEEMIEAVGGGHRNITQEFDESEIGQIGNKFKEMVNNNLELKEHLLSSQLKEREAELSLLQSQINPHFLYNTLDSLYCMAVIQEADHMAQMIDALSRTFRLSLNKGNKLILAGNEIEHIKSYMEVQNFRYNNRFELILDIDKSLEEIYILKFILQPFVENAMYHGLEPRIGKGYIKVTGTKTGADIIFTIEDNGIGMEDISVIHKGCGISNVIERIHLFYGEAYGVEVRSTPGQGTIVQIKVAVTKKEGGILDEKSLNS